MDLKLKQELDSLKYAEILPYWRSAHQKNHLFYKSEAAYYLFKRKRAMEGGEVNMAKEGKNVDDFVVGLELLRAFKRIKAFAQINIESLNKKLLEREAMYEDTKRLRVALGQVEELLKLVD